MYRFSKKKAAQYRLSNEYVMLVSQSKMNDAKPLESYFVTHDVVFRRSNARASRQDLLYKEHVRDDMFFSPRWTENPWASED